jgi:hypothetical protein
MLCCARALAQGETSWLASALAKDGSSESGQGGAGGSGSQDGGSRGESGPGGGGGSGSQGGGNPGGNSGGAGQGSLGDGPGRADGAGRGHGLDDAGSPARGRGRGSEEALAGAWGTTTPERAREAVAQGWALPLSSVLPTISKAVPGQVLEVDLRQTRTGEWRYEVLVLTRDRRYQEIVVDARRNQVVQIRSR